jgi:hypothetical protein
MLHCGTEFSASQHKNSASQNRHAASRHNFLIFRFPWSAPFLACVTRHSILKRDMTGKTWQMRGKLKWQNQLNILGLEIFCALAVMLKRQRTRIGTSLAYYTYCRISLAVALIFAPWLKLPDALTHAL